MGLRTTRRPNTRLAPCAMWPSMDQTPAMFFSNKARVVISANYGRENTMPILYRRIPFLTLILFFTLAVQAQSGGSQQQSQAGEANQIPQQPVEKTSQTSVQSEQNQTKKD